MNEFDLIGFTINNFRVFGEETKFDLAPLTILTGTNSSGKSSFTKALRLLTESYRANGLRKLELMESELKLGDFNSIKNLYGKSDLITFGLLIRVPSLNLLSDGDKFFIQLVYNSTSLQFIKVEKNGNEIFIQESDNNKYGNFHRIKSFIRLPPNIININKLKETFKDLDEDNLNHIHNSALNYLQENIDAHTFKDGYLLYKRSDILNELFEDTMGGLEHIGGVRYAHGRYFDQKLNEDVEYEEEIVISANPQLNEILPAGILEITSDKIQNEYLSTYLSLDTLKNLKIFPLGILHNLFNRFEFIEGVRATQEIVYTKHNSPNFYETLSRIYSSGQVHFFLNSDFKNQVVNNFKLLQPSDEIELKQITGYGYILEIRRNGINIGLQGLGYGVTQLLPILMKVHLSTNAIFIIEEPESNLHPALQSKLADFFVSYINGTSEFSESARFIIETHSEYLIRKLQYLTVSEKSELKEKDTVIYYFYTPDNIPPGEEQIKKININKDGSLTDDFGQGFFDEATNWKFELLKLNNPQKN